MVDFRFFLILLAVSSIVDSLQMSFVIESYTVVSGAVLSQFEVNSIRECSLLCLGRTDCGGFNYVIKSDGSAHCLLIDVKKEAKEEDSHVPEGVLYSSRKISLNKDCSTRTFAFEKFAHLKAISKEIILESGNNHSLHECLRMCQERSDCRAAQFSGHNASCDLLRASPNFVYNVRNHFAYSNNVNVYENNCLKVSMSSSKCTYMRINSAGFTDFYDEVIPNIKDVEECERVCIVQEKVADPCRSYTYDSRGNHCYVSHQDSRSSGRSPLSTRDRNLVHGSLDDCIDFGLKCHNDALEIRGLSMRLFSGSMKTKRKKEVICERNISASFDFVVRMPYEDCGIDMINSPFPSHSGLVHVKEGSTNLITIRDKILQVNCRIHSEVDVTVVDQMVIARMNIEEPNNTLRTLSNSIIYAPSKSSRPRYTLMVLNGEGVETDIVRSGEQGWLSLKVNDDSQKHIFVSNMLVRDINTKQIVNLIGDDGCVTRHDYILGILRLSPMEIRYKISFSGFDEQSQLVYQALVETCTFDCSPMCNRKLWLKDMERKDLSENSVRAKRTIGARQIELTQDIYKVHGSRITILTSPSSHKQSHTFKIQYPHVFVEKELHNDEVDAHTMEDQAFTSALQHCFSDDITCLFTVILASIQLFLLASCICIIYCYIQQWRSYRGFHESVQTQIQYELNEENTLPKGDVRSD